MGDHSAIEWTEATWNPTTGCDRTSPGCDNCYAMTLSKRLKAMGQAEVPARRRPPDERPGLRPHAPPRHARHPTHVVGATRDLRQLDERPVPQGRAGRLHPPGVRGHRRHAAAPVPGAHQAVEAARRDRPAARLATQPLDGRQRREHQVPVPARPPTPGRRRRSLRERRTAARPARGPRPRRDPLADRRRRERPTRPADGRRVGHRPPRPVRRRGRARSSSSSGAVAHPRPAVASSTAAPTTRCPRPGRRLGMTRRRDGWDWWSEVKLQILHDYLQGFTRVVRRESCEADLPRPLCRQLREPATTRARDVRWLLTDRADIDPTFTRLVFFELTGQRNNSGPTSGPPARMTRSGASSRATPTRRSRQSSRRLTPFDGHRPSHSSTRRVCKWHGTPSRRSREWRADKKTKVEQWMLFPEPALGRVLGLREHEVDSSADRLDRLFGTNRVGCHPPDAPLLAKSRRR